MQWRGEWACTHAYEDGPRLRTLRPDAEETYTNPGGVLHFYLEVDRGTMRVWRLAAKLARYYAYRCSVGCGQITLLLVTSGHERAATALRLNAMLAARRGAPPLDLHVTTDAELAEHGARGRIWRGGGGLRDTLRLRAQGTVGASNAVAEQRRE